MMTLIEAAEKILRFQYLRGYYERFECSSCGSIKYQNYSDGKDYQIEECSKHCPWRQLKEAIKDAKSQR